MKRKTFPHNPAIAIAVVAAMAAMAPATAAPLSVSEIPLFVASGLKPNVMLTLANSNSMDEDATGLAVGSADPNSRSEISRRVAKNLIVNYGGAFNLGLTAFQQSGVVLNHLHSSPYDISFDPANYDPAYAGPRDAPTKKFREPNASWPGNYIYFNVNLPFYAGSNQGNRFCYSRTADAFNNNELVTGIWDSYRCFFTKNSTSDTLPPTNAQDVPNGWQGAVSTYTFFPTDSDLGQGITDFGRFMSWRWVSLTWFNNGSPGGGYVHVPVANVDATQANKMNVKLGTSQFVTNGPTNPALPLQNAGLTPLEGTLFTLRDYFAGSIADAARGGPLPAPPNSCRKNYSVVMTNGLPSVTRFGVPSDDVATMLTAATTAANTLRTSGVLSYIVGFALPFGVNPAQLDTIAAAGGTGTSYYATDEATLISELNSVFNDILERSGAAGAVALNSGSIQTNSRLFQAKFNTGDWSGQLQSFSIDSTSGTIAATSNWDAADTIDAQNWDTGRKILSWNPVSRRAIAFRWPAAPATPTVTEMSPAQITALNTNVLAVNDGMGSQRVQYIRGSAANEGSGATNFRRRNASKLGDIVNSSPAYVGGPNKNLSDSTYVSFKSSYAGRQPMIYVGSNDGMLHGLNADTGVEVMGYVPSPVYSRLSGLTAQGFQHKYLVDGSPVTGDVKFSGGWRTVLVGGLSGGGRGLFAIDVTDPTRFSEASPGNTVLWEFTAADDSELGLTYAQGSIVKMNDGSPAVVIGNGYNNTGSGRAVLFIINAETGALIRKIDTGVGTVADPNGLSTPAVIDLDGNGTADYAYAGDIKGNLWKFDLTSNSSGSWSRAYGAPLFQAADSLGTAQPITSTVEVTRHPQGGLMILFGTGQYIQMADVANTQTQSLYGIRDSGAVVTGRPELQAQTITDTATAGGATYRKVSSNAVNYPTQKGWYLDLPTAGERIVVDPILRFGRLIVPTTIPNADPCAAGGSSWLMEVDYLGGGRLNKPVFDVNVDDTVDNTDLVSFSSGSDHGSGVRIDAIASSPAVVRGFGDDGSLENKYLNQSNGNIARVLESGEPLSNRRTSWRQIL